MSGLISKPVSKTTKPDRKMENARGVSSKDMQNWKPKNLHNKKKSRQGQKLEIHEPGNLCEPLGTPLSVPIPTNSVLNSLDTKLSETVSDSKFPGTSGFSFST